MQTSRQLFFPSIFALGLQCGAKKRLNAPYKVDGMTWQEEACAFTTLLSWKPAVIENMIALKRKGGEIEWTERNNILRSNVKIK